MAAKKKKKKKSKGFDLGPAPEQPKPRSLSDEMGALSPFLSQLGEQTSDQYIKSQKELTQYQYDFLKQHYDELAGMERDQQSKATAQVRGDSLNWLGQYGGQVRADQRASNPEWAAAQDATTRMLGQMGKESQFTPVLDQQAMQELKLGGQLTPEQERMAQQSSRAAYAARGQAMSNPSAIAEVMSRDQMSQQRLRERQQIATGREAVGLQQTQQNRQYALEAGRLSAAESLAPQFLGMTSQGTPASTMMTFEQGVRTPDPSTSYSAMLGYGSDLYNTNLNMAAANYNSYQNNSAALEAAQASIERPDPVGEASGRCL